LAYASKYDLLTDDELIARYRRTQDNEWLGRLLERYAALLLGVAMKYLKDKNLAEDAVQQVFLKAITHFPEGNIANFKGWLYVLTRNHCFQELRDKPHFAAAEAIDTVLLMDTGIEDKRLHEATLESLTQAIAELAIEQQTAITLFYLKRKTYEQIVALTGYNFMQVKSYIQNGKRNLKAILTKKMMPTK
jgi:RNA polymerase sigma factor (sigma-70 family)